MTFKSEWHWYILGASVLALVGLINSDNRVYFFGVMGVGWMSLMIAARKGGLSQPRTAITLLVVMNLAFWLSYGLWRLRVRLVAVPTFGGTDPFAVAVAIWLIAIATCTLYVSMIFVRGLFAVHQRQISLIGLAGVVVQLLTTGRYIYSLIQGV